MTNQNLRNLEAQLAESARNLSNLTASIPNSGYFQHRPIEVKKMSGLKKFFLTAALLGAGFLGLVAFSINQQQKEFNKRHKEWMRIEAIENAKIFYVLDARPKVDYVEYSESKGKIQELASFYSGARGIQESDIKCYSLKKGDMDFRGNNYDENPFVYWADSKDSEREDYFVSQRKYKDSFFNMFNTQEYDLKWGYKEYMPRNAVCLDSRFER